MRLGMPDLSTPAHKQRFLLYAGAAAIFALMAFAMIMPLASNATFCGVVCHSQNPEFQTWKKSSHAAITCYACHVDKASITAVLYAKVIEGPKGIIHEVTGSLEKPINAESEYSQLHVPRARCERCHTNENRKFTFTRGIYMNHLAHKAAGINCTVCHNRVVHKGAEEYEPLKSEWPEAKGFEYENFITMKQGCFRCHSSNPDERNPKTMKLILNDKTPPQACTTCHTKDFKLPVGHRGDTWRTEHGAVAKTDFKYCFSCHDAGKKFANLDRAWCTLCHDDSTVARFKQIMATQPESTTTP